jgi:hypothetical protein
MDNTFGILAEFENPGKLLSAVKKTRDSGYITVESYSPFPIHGMDAAMQLKDSPVGWIVFWGGAFGLLVGFGLQTWVATSAYKLTISGKPFFSYPAFIPVTFELMVLFAAFGAFFGNFILNGLPKFYHSLFKSKNFASATSHGFFMSIESSDKNYDLDKTVSFVKELGGENIEILEK